MMYKANLVDVTNRDIYPAEIKISDGKIISIEKISEKVDNYIIPAFVDSHIHVESTMLTPYEYSRVSSIHGTVISISDPHEIANVLGIDGVKFMIENAKDAPTQINFSAPSCVPASPFETAGAELSAKDIEELFEMGCKNLGEVMNLPAVLSGDDDMMKKIEHCKKRDLVADGHAPFLSGNDLKQYIDAGITTDHECSEYSEAEEKIKKGMKILIREGSAAKNFDKLISLIEKYPDDIMFCSDDLHPDDLEKGHINLLVKKAVSLGYDIFDILKAASVNACNHYKLDMGLLNVGNSADFIVIDDLKNINVLETVFKGEVVAKGGKSLKEYKNSVEINNFNTEEVDTLDIQVKVKSDKMLVIGVKDGELLTDKLVVKPKIENGYAVSDTDNDILKIVVVNRYESTAPAVGFIKGFGLKAGAIASSVAHDSHNIIAVGISDEEIVAVINAVIYSKGGVSVIYDNALDILKLPIAGLMSNLEYCQVSEIYERLTEFSKNTGTSLHAPFMTLSFMALPVIPELKMTDKGLFDSTVFKHTNLFI